MRRNRTVTSPTTSATTTVTDRLRLGVAARGVAPARNTTVASNTADIMPGIVMPESFSAKPSTATDDEARARWRRGGRDRAPTTRRSDRGWHEPEVRDEQRDHDERSRGARSGRAPRGSPRPCAGSRAWRASKSVERFSKNLPTWVRWSAGRRRSTSPTATTAATTIADDPDAAAHRERAARAAATSAARTPGTAESTDAEVVAPERRRPSRRRSPRAAPIAIAHPPRRAAPATRAGRRTARPAPTSCANVMLPWPTKRMPMVGE